MPRPAAAPTPGRGPRSGSHPGHLRRGSALTSLLLLGGTVLPTACAPPQPPRPAPGEVEAPTADSVEAVLFLVGDAGDVLPGRSPVLADLRGEVERWSAALPRDSVVTVLYLGDNVYPSGVHETGDDDFPADSLRLRSQVDVVTGGAASAHGTMALFLPGNHDWGNMAGVDGLRRLRNQEALLAAFRREGTAVDLAPDAGDPGPAVVDVAGRVRLILLDTQWWLQSEEPEHRDRFLTGVEEALRGAGPRDVVLAAHHPFRSGGSHGGPTPVWEGLGILWLLRRSGALVQDMSSAPYRELAEGLRTVFGAEGPPVVYAGGHDHSLQVIQGRAADAPRWSLVSGAGSKLSGVSRIPGMRLGLERPGYMRLTFVRGGGILLHVRATTGPGTCPHDGRRLERCMRRGLERFGLAWAGRLR